MYLYTSIIKNTYSAETICKSSQRYIVIFTHFCNL